MRRRAKGVSKYNKSPMRSCTAEDFEDRGVTVDENFAIVVE